METIHAYPHRTAADPLSQNREDRCATGLSDFGNSFLTSRDPANQIEKKYELLDPDVRLMLKVRDGSAPAFEQLVERYQARLIAVLQHLVPYDRDQAEDLAQEVFMRVYRARENYTPGAKFSTWLFTIANNVASNALRKLSRKKEVHVQMTRSGQLLSQSLDEMAKDASGLMPARQLDKAEVSEIVRLALRSLNERQKMALLLSKFENMSYQDIADSMGLSTQAVKSLLSRARCNLKTILQPYVQSGQMPPEKGTGVPQDLVQSSPDESELKP